MPAPIVWNSTEVTSLLAVRLLLPGLSVALPAASQISGYNPPSGSSNHDLLSSSESARSWASELSTGDASVVSVDRSLNFSAAGAVMVSILNRAASGLPWQDASQELGQTSRDCGAILAAFATGALPASCVFRSNPARDSDVKAATIPE
jgi:hypothetical protein